MKVPNNLLKKRIFASFGIKGLIHHELVEKTLVVEF